MSNKLAEAFIAMQGELPTVEPDATNPHFNSKFVSLGHLLAKVRPVLNKHGFSVVQLPSRAEDGTPTLRTLLLHVSGESIETEAPLLLPKNDPQGQGSAITYMRRYALSAALGISDQEDDDANATSAANGEAASQPKGDEPATTKQKTAMTRAFNKAGVAEEYRKDIIKGIAGDPPSKAGASKILDVLFDDESDLSGDERVQKLAGMANAIPPTDVPTDLTDLPTVDEALASGTIGGEE